LNATTTLLVVDDDAEIRDLLSRYLSDHGFRVLTAGDGAQMRAVQASHAVDLVILDLMLPGEDGLAICRRLRAESQLPIIMLTARTDNLERVVGLELGADDYITKPFEPRELVARIRAVLRRTRPETPLPEPTPRAAAPVGCYRFAGWILDPDARSLRDAAGRAVELSPGEFDLLMAFVQSPRQVLDRDRLLERTRGGEATPFDRSIDVQVSRLRRKIEDTHLSPNLIQTVRGAGYIFTAKVVRE
jgi:two-component system OmpR family response regulator